MTGIPVKPDRARALRYAVLGFVLLGAGIFFVTRPNRLTMLLAFFLIAFSAACFVMVGRLMRSEIYPSDRWWRRR